MKAERLSPRPAGRWFVRWPFRTRGGRAPYNSKPIYTRQQITEMARRRQKGLIGDADWARWEYELIAAGREGRVVGALDPETGLARSVGG